jgi:inorganic pyrophosphatase
MELPFMEENYINRFLDLAKFFSKPHPWHGISIGDNVPEMVQVYLEIVPEYTMKYELDKATGYLKIDRPQRYSNICPTPYGFIPQSYCGELVAEYCMEKTGREDIQGDHDPLDMCVITERNIPHGNLLAETKPVGGLRMIDHNEADDKILSVIESDALYGSVEDVSELSDKLVERVAHYFLTYKEMPHQDGEQKVEITDIYGRDEAFEVIERSQRDYAKKFGPDKRELASILQQGLT